MTGIFGDQLDDGTIPEDKLDSSVQTKLNAGLQIATGFYVGDGTNDRVIVTGFTSIKHLQIDAQEDRGGGVFSHWTTFKNDQMAGKLAWFASSGSVGDKLTEIAFVGGNFTVDAGNMNVAPGANTTTYFWTTFGV